MRMILAAALAALAAVPAVAAQDAKQDKPPVAVVEQRRNVDVVFCIDRSGSMQQVIDTAKRKVWSIVNEIAAWKPTPVLRIGLIGYGSADRDIKFFPLSTDLDKVYEDLLTFRTDMGGDEWVGWAVKKATEEMKWSTEKRAMKVIFMVGNETAAQGRAEVLYTVTVPEAIKKDIQVNAIYCGKPSVQEEKTWMEVGKLADGTYTTIDITGGTITVETPHDKKLVELNQKLNATYIPFGTQGQAGKDKQELQDRKAAEAGGAPTAAARAQSKAGGVYTNAHWDLVDAAKEKDFDLAKMKVEELPKEMQTMTPEERKAHVEKKRQEREAVQKEISQLGVERQKFIDAEIKNKNLTQDSAFDEQVRRSLREQAAKK